MLSRNTCLRVTCNKLGWPTPTPGSRYALDVLDRADGVGHVRRMNCVSKVACKAQAADERKAQAADERWRLARTARCPSWRACCKA